MTDIFKITNLYLYDKQTAPANKADDDLIRLEDEDSDITINTDDFMKNGAGRFAKAPMFDFVSRFFNDDTVPAGTYTKQDIASTRYGYNYYGWNMQQYDWKDGTNDYAQRVYIYNSSAFKVADEARFVVEANGTKYIRNFAIIPDGNDNFDFNSNDGLAALGNPILGSWIDPSDIGRKVNINFSPYTVDTVYSKEEFQQDQSTVNSF
jgi:hypothetical protein